MPLLIELDENRVMNLYSKYRSLRKVAKTLDVSVEPIRRILHSNQIEMNSSRLYKIDENYFRTINTEHKAYWPGFLYADGCVRIRKDTSHSLSFKQHKRDKDIFVKFNKCLNSNYPFRPVKNTNTYQIEIGSKKLVKSLILKGCIPRKSLTLSFPEKSILPADLQRHFIRGYFDGDGCISITRIKKQPRLTMAGTRDVTRNIKEVLIKEGMGNVRVDLHANKKAKNKLWYVTLSSKKNILPFYEYVYKDATVFMERKYKKFIEIIEAKYLEYKRSTNSKNEIN